MCLSASSLFSKVAPTHASFTHVSCRVFRPSAQSLYYASLSSSSLSPRTLRYTNYCTHACIYSTYADAYCLADRLSQHPDDIARALKEYESTRMEPTSMYVANACSVPKINTQSYPMAYIRDTMMSLMAKAGVGKQALKSLKPVM